MTDISEVTRMIEDQGRKADEFRAVQIKRIDDMDKALTDLEKRAGRPSALDASGNTGAPRETWVDCKSGKAVPILRHGESLAALVGKSADAPSLGRLARHRARRQRTGRARAGGRSLNLGIDTGGGYTVTGSLAAEWVDALRAQSALSQPR